tara:strand:- start:948 stop:1172 length:225 start_codon:yes stop_codon:yes gene_type:complete
MLVLVSAVCRTFKKTHLWISPSFYAQSSFFQLVAISISPALQQFPLLEHRPQATSASIEHFISAVFFDKMLIIR